MTTRWRVTTDLLTGKRFRWNDTITVNGVVVPARITSRTNVWLHPDRVSQKLLAELNNSTPSYAQRLASLPKETLLGSILWFKVKS